MTLERRSSRHHTGYESRIAPRQLLCRCLYTRVLVELLGQLATVGGEGAYRFKIRIATLDERGQAVTLPNLDGEMLTPSAVLIDEGSAVVGQSARDVALLQPQVSTGASRSHEGVEVRSE